MSMEYTSYSGLISLTRYADKNCHFSTNQYILMRYQQWFTDGTVL